MTLDTEVKLFLSELFLEQKAKKKPNPTFFKRAVMNKERYVRYVYVYASMSLYSRRAQSIFFHSSL